MGKPAESCTLFRILPIETLSEQILEKATSSYTLTLGMAGVLEIQLKEVTTRRQCVSQFAPRPLWTEFHP